MTEGEKTILTILAESVRPLYGLEIVKRSDGRVGRGSVYVWLVRLEEDGFVDSGPYMRGLARIQAVAIGRRAMRATGLPLVAYKKAFRNIIDRASHRGAGR